VQTNPWEEGQTEEPGESAENLQNLEAAREEDFVVPAGYARSAAGTVDS
jgi:hypothetical protein